MPQQHSRIQRQNEPEEGYIRKLIAEGEHQRLDFKFGITDSRKIARTMVAFANTEGGRLLIGVKDNGSIAGVRSEEELYMIQAASELYTHPNVPFEMKEWTIDKKRVLEIIIPKSRDILYSAPQKKDDYLVYIRTKDQNFPVNAVWLKAHKWRNSKNGTFIQFGEKEQLFLKILEQEEKISQSRYCKLAKINSRLAENTIAGFVAIGMVHIQFTQNGVLYVLSNKYLDLSPEQRLKTISQHTSAQKR